MAKRMDEAGGDDRRESKAGSSAETEVRVPKGRRVHSAEYKRRILDEASRLTERGALGALLRREGLYSSHLAAWRAQRDAGFEPQKPGRKPKLSADQKRIAELEKALARSTEELRKRDLIIAVQKKLGKMLGSMELGASGEDS